MTSGVSAGKNQRVKSSCQFRSFHSQRTIERAGAECATEQEQKREADFFLAKPKPKQSEQNTTSKTSRSSSQRGRGRPFITSPGRDLRPSAQSPSKTSQTLGSWCPQPKSKHYYCWYSPIDTASLASTWVGITPHNWQSQKQS